MLGFHFIGTILLLTLILLILLATAFWLWMLVDCLFNKSLRETQKVLWLFLILLIFFTHILGAIVYFFIGRSKKNVDYQPSQGASVQNSQPHQL